MEFSSPMVNLYTRDLPAALAFYGGLLGFEETFRAPTPEAPDHVELRLDGVTVALSTAEAAERVHGLPAAPGSHGFQLVVWTDDVDAAFDTLVAAGAPGHTGPTTRATTIATPWSATPTATSSSWSRSADAGALTHHCFITVCR